MKKNYIEEVIKRFYKEEHSAEMNEKVQQWLMDEEYENEKNDALYELWEDEDGSLNNETISALANVKNNLGLDVQKKKRLTLPLKVLRVACISFFILMFTAGIYYFSIENKTVEYTANLGEMKKIDLPDGSEVWLNAGSAITYHKKISNKRIIKLSGEAFFDVKPDSMKPFIVEVNRLAVRVLGTSFNIEEYPDDSRTVVTLNTGRIKVDISNEDAGSYFLEPNQQLIYNHDSGVELQKVRANEINSWKDGNLIFYNTTLNEIIHKLERYFNIKIVIHGIGNNDDYYSVKFIDGENIDQIMNVLSKMGGDFTYEIIVL